MTNELDWDKLMEEQKNFEQENPDPWRHPAGPYFQASAKLRLERERLNYQNGDKMALLAAIRICAHHDLILPDWVAKDFISTYDKVLNCRSGSWDEVFGKPYPNKHLASLRRRQNLRFQVYIRIREIIQEHERHVVQENGDIEVISTIAIDDQLFERVGAEFEIKKTLCNELYYEAKNLMPLK